MGKISNIYNSNSMYLREIGKPAHYIQKTKIKITTYNKTILYLYLDKEHHIKFTKERKYGSSFSRTPKYYNSWVDYINKQYPGSQVELEWEVNTTI